jgi:YD repeat-containing protein
VKIDHDNDNNQSTPDVGQGGRLEAMTTGVWDVEESTFDSTVQNFGYLYDANGNIDWIKDFKAGVDPQNPQVQDFEYDTLDRLTSAEVTGGSVGVYDEDYSYDLSGRLETKGDVTLNYDDAAHVHAVSSTDNGTPTNTADDNLYVYDANGNQTTRTVDGETFNLEYDAEGRMVRQDGKGN